MDRQADLADPPAVAEREQDVVEQAGLLVGRQHDAVPAIAPGRIGQLVQPGQALDAGRDGDRRHRLGLRPSLEVVRPDDALRSGASSVGSSSNRFSGSSRIRIMSYSASKLWTRMRRAVRSFDCH